MPGTMVEKLQLVVDATTGAAESRFSKLTATARETGDTSVRAASSVEDAANRVAQAQLKQQDAAGALRVAQQRLTDLQEKGNASATQLAAAEEKVAAAQRRLHLAAKDVVGSLAQQNQVQEEAAAGTEKARRGAGALSDQLGGLKAEALGLITGVGLASFLKDSVTGFLEGARAANGLKISMNTTTEVAGQLGQLFRTIGLEADDILEIQAQFAQTTQALGTGLTAVGNEVTHNRDGTVDWALTLTDTLAELQKIPDATERNRLGFAMFGEEGYKQLSRLLTSGVSVRDALERIGTPFTDKDIAAAQRYDAAMMRLQLSGASLGRTVGRELVPLVADAVDAFGEVASIVTSIPLPLTLATAAAVILGITGFSPAAVAGARLGAAMALVRTEVALASVAMAEGGVAAGILSAGLSTAAAAGGRLLTLVGGPLGAGLIILAAAYSAVSAGAEDLKEHAHAAALEVEKLGGTSNDQEANTLRMARELAAEAGAWERLAAGIRGYQDLAGNDQGLGSVDFGGIGSGMAGLGGLFGETETATHGFEEAIRDARKELGEYGAQQEAAQLATAGLTELIAQGDTSSREFAAAVKLAAESQNTQAASSDRAKAAIDAYNAVTRDAVESVHALLDAQLQAQDAEYGYLSALDDVNAARDDEKTSVDEVAQAHNALKQAALSAADAAADAAVAQAKAAGTIVDPLTEANIRADAMLTNLREKLNQPGLSEGAQADLAALITQLQTAKDSGDVQALVTLTGADEVAGELDQATEDRDTTVQVESRGGPAVKEYLDRLADQERLAIIRVESRGGPAVDNYLDGLAHERLAIIRVETRGGPDVDRYLDNLADQDRTAVIDVRRNGAGAPAAPTGAPRVAGLAGLSGAGGSVTVQSLTVQVTSDSAGNLTQRSLAEAGRQYVAAIGAYEQRNGPGWRRPR